MKKIKLFEIYMSERLYRCTHQYLLISAAAIISASWLNSLNRNFANGNYCLFFWNAGPGRLLEETTMAPRWNWHIECTCAMKETVLCVKCIDFNLKLSLHHFCLISWCLNGCFISFRNKTMHCISYIGSSQAQNIDYWRGFLLRTEDYNKPLAG